MKRAREEVEEEEQAAPAPMASSPARNPGAAAAAVPSGTGELRVVTREEVLAFVRSVKRAFSPAKYLEFFSVLRQVESIGVRGVLDHAKVMLRGHRDLKRHFNRFLPPQYKLSLTEEVEQGELASRPIVID